MKHRNIKMQKHKSKESCRHISSVATHYLLAPTIEVGIVTLKYYLLFIAALTANISFSQKNISHSNTKISEEILGNVRSLIKTDTIQAIDYITSYENASIDSLYIELFLIKDKLLINHSSNKRYFSELYETVAKAQEEKWLSLLTLRKGQELIAMRNYQEADSIIMAGIKPNYNDRSVLIQLKMELSRSFIAQSKFGPALNLIDSTISLMQNNIDTVSLIKALNNKAICERYLGKIDSSIITFDKALKINYLIKDSARIARNLLNIGNLHLQQTDYSYAKEYFIDALGLYEKIDDNKGRIKSLMSLGTVYEQKNQPDSSNYYFTKGYQLSSLINDQGLKNKIVGALGSSHYFLGELNKAESLLEQAIKNEKSPIAKCAYLQRLGLVQRDKGNIKVAIDTYKNAYKISLEAGIISMQGVNLKQLAKLTASISNFEEAYEYLSRQVILNDSIFDKDKTKIIIDFNKKYELAKKNSEKAIIAKDLENQSTKATYFKRLALLLGALFLTCLALLRSLWKSNILKKTNNTLLQEKNQLLTEKNEELIFELKEVSLLNKKLKQRIEKSKNSTSKIEILGFDKKHFVNISEIIFYKAENEGTRIYLDSNSIWSPSKFKEIDALILDEIFVQIFRSVVVNVTKIKWINHSTLLMVNNQELKISRTYRQRIMDLLEN